MTAWCSIGRSAPARWWDPTGPIVTLIPPQLEVDVNVDEAQLGKVRQAQTVQVVVPAYPDQPFAGTVATIAPAVDQKTRTSAVHIQPRDPQGQLKPGMLATVSVTVADRPDALLVPRTALGSNITGGPDSVVTIDPTGHAIRTQVQIGLTSGDQVEITSGLSDGQLVATGNTGGLTDGEIVQPQVQALTAGALVR